MTRLFGYTLETDFDLAKEQRQDRVGRALIAALVLSCVYDVSGLPFATQVFQAALVTILSYGLTFYVKQKQNLHSVWLWKAVLLTIPVHMLYLFGIFWSDRAFPEVMTKALAFVWILAVESAIESIYFFDRILGWFAPHKAENPPESITQS